MSYLDVPRLHFSGTFMANPSTINNDPTNYDPSLVQGPSPNPTNIGLVLSWNPYGSHAFTIDAQVTSFVDKSGKVHTSGDPLIGAAFASYAPQVPAKLVDLDTEQQGVTRLFGLNLQLTVGGTALLQGLWENAGTLINLWLNRVPSTTGDSAAGGAFQSVLQNLKWSDGGGSTLLGQLQTASSGMLSARFSVYGYQDSNTSTNFRNGVIVGTIGPYSDNEPRHIPPRLLLPAKPSTTPAPLAWAPAKVNNINMATIDLGNSIPDANPGGPPLPLGTLAAAVLSGGTPVPLGTINYQSPSFVQTAGVVQFPITAAQAGQPLAILVDGAPQLAERADGVYIDVDGASVYMNPGDTAQVSVRATKFGSPDANKNVPLALVPTSPPADFDNNQPASALTFPPSVTTGANGSAAVSLSATNPAPLPLGRQNIGGQLYYLGGPWAAGNVWNGDSAGFFASPLSVKLFNSIEPPIAEPTWADVQPILFKYYYLYAYMASIVDLSNYASVKAGAQAIAHVLSLPIGDPSYMPVTREMSNDERKLILAWIALGCPQ